jgi:hypothetical protein
MRPRAIGNRYDWILGYGVVICDTPKVVFDFGSTKANDIIKVDNEAINNFKSVLSRLSHVFHSIIMFLWNLGPGGPARALSLPLRFPTTAPSQYIYTIITPTRSARTLHHGKPTAEVSNAINHTYTSR